MSTTLANPGVLTAPDQVDSPVIETPQLLQAWCTDMAQKIYEYRDIAERYGFTGEQAMFDYLASRPTLRRRIRELRAAWESDDNVETRVRRLAGHTVLEAIPSTAQIMFDDKLKPAERIDALKAHARLAGVDGLPTAAASGVGAGVGGSGGGKFSVQIIFGSTGQVETITTVDPKPEPPTIEGEAS